MKKKMGLFAALLTFAFVPNVFAAGEEAKIGEDVYATFEQAVAAAGENDVIVLQEDVVLDATWLIKDGKSYEVDLNNHSISRTSNIINIDGGSLILKGTGSVVETTPDNAGVKLLGSDDINDTDYSYLKVGSGVTIKAWAPVFVSIKKVGGVWQDHAYGVKVDVEGTLIACKDTANADGVGVYINGTIKDLNNYPVINIADNAVIDANGAAVYQAGYSNITIGKAKLTGVSSGIAIKAGKLTLNGPSVKATGVAEDPSANNSGVNGVGAAIQVESGLGYAGNMEININGGTYESENNSAIVEYLAEATSTHPATTETQVSEIKIADGNFVAKEGKEVLTVSDDFKETNTNFISGGTYSSNVKEYLSKDVAATEDENGEFVINKKYNLNLNDTTNGTVVVDKTEAVVGETVTIKPTASEGYQLDKIIVTDKNGNPVTVENGKFVMPDSEIDIKVMFVKVENPNTADINHTLLISVLTLGLAGLGLTLKKKRFN